MQGPERFIYVSVQDKIEYFERKPVARTYSVWKRRQLRHLRRFVEQDRVRGRSGRIYEDGQPVFRGRPTCMGKRVPVKRGYVTVFRKGTMSYLFRDGVPVEMVHRSVVKNS